MDITESLSTALRDRYRIVRELGAGGMATVYLAEDLKHHRKVAVKVLRPELASAIGPERFLREIEIAANLTHPHILPLFDSGEADGFLFYAMPYIEGESLRDRLEREKQLALDDAVEITRQVARALGYAHDRKVVHRDVKPENILLAGGEAVVADFGIAKAMQAAGGESLTQTGMAVGTPAYMSPEQAAGTRDLDGRSDLYGLGCVLYEMLAGQAPFTGPTVESIVRQHLIADAPSVTVIREAVPAEIADVIQRAMAKTPADRFRTASEFADALRPGVVTPATGSIPGAAPARPRRIGLVAASVAVVLAVAVAFSILRLTSAPGPSLDPDLVAVVPFRVNARDASLQYLAEGMVDLLAAKLTGDGGPRAVTPGLVLRTWSQMDAAEDGGGEDIGMVTAANVGAGLLLSGGVVQEQDRLLINATLRAVPDGEVRGQTSIGGPPDSLPTLVDRLTAELLSLQAGQEVGRLAALTSTSLPALRAYLQGQAASRGGRYDEARDHLHRALDLDSTFALAGLSAALNWSGSPRGRGTAWQHRDRLSQGDRILLTALVGEDPSVPRSWADVLAAWEGAVWFAPDRPRAWVELGETLFHWGRIMALDAPLDRAAAAFNRALALDSSLATPLVHGMEIATLTGDEAEVRRLGTSFLALDPPAAADGYVRWHMAHVLNDSAAIGRIRPGLDTLGNRSLLEIFQIGQWFGFGIEDVVRVTEAGLSRAGTGFARSNWLSYSATVAHNRGRPAEALMARQAAQQLDPSSRTGIYLRRVVLDAMYWNGDSATAAQAVRERAPYADAALSRTVSARAEQFEDICTVEQWRLWQGQAASAPEAIRKLRSYSAPPDSRPVVHQARYCATLLETMTAVVEDRPAAPEAVARLDSLWQTGIAGLPNWLLRASPLVISRLHEAMGDVPGALAAIRRRHIYGPNQPEYFSSYVREEGRLAALVGDREGAIRAYQHYLALRDDPEPSVQPEVDAVRAALVDLVDETTR